MTVDPRTSSLDLPIEWSQLSQAAVDEMTAAMAAAYVATYRGPHPGAPNTEAADTGPLIRAGAQPEAPRALIEAHERLADAARARDGDGRDANPQDEGDWTVAGECSATWTARSPRLSPCCPASESRH